MKFFRDNDLKQFEDTIEQYFVTNDYNGNERPLVPNGQTIRVTNENKNEFIRLKCDSIAKKWSSEQLKKIKSGFNSVIDDSWVSFMTINELEAQLCG